jgi:4-hydroxyphenylpyruvate dioxygenase-like putative hemolysin
MARARRAKQKPQKPSATAPASWRQGLIVVGVIQHPATGHYQVWLHARGQTAMLLAFRTLEQADAAKQALGEALLRGEHATPERWVAAVAAIGAETDIEVAPVSDEVFAAINAEIQDAELSSPEALMQRASLAVDDPAMPPARVDAHTGVPARRR